MNLKNRTVLITGATSGIGLALSRKFSKLGCRVIAVGRSSEKLNAIEDELEGVIAIKCDISSKAGIIELVKTINGLDHRVSILVNNAAVQFTPKFTDSEFSFDGIEKEINTNFTSIAWLTSQMLPMLLSAKDGAAIVNMSSGLAIYPKTTSAIYSATKAAVHSLTRSLRYQLEDTGVSVIEILLPLVDTAMTEGRGSGKITAEKAADEVLNALTHNVDECYVGKAKILPFISRISPSLTKRILKNA